MFIDDEEGVEMSLMVILILLLIPLSFFELLFEKSERSQRFLFQIAFFMAFFVVFIKYYYGTDIKIYTSLYDSIASVSLYDSSYFEPGFLLFLRFCKAINLSFWWVTALITFLYFSALRLIFLQIPKYRVLALLILVVFDYNLMFFELRQCMAVAFFLLAYISHNSQKKIAAFCYLILVILFHKSGIFMVVMFGITIGMKNTKVKSYLYGIAIFCMLLLISLPIERILALVLKVFDDGVVIRSVEHHLLVVDNFQLVYIVYVLLSVLLYLIAKKEKEASFDSQFVFVSFVLIVLFVKHWFLLNRIRSYFLPIILMYIFSNQQHIERKIIKQIAFSGVAIYMLLTTFLLYRNIESAKSKVNYPQTIFSLLKHSKSEIIEKTDKRIDKFWKDEYKFTN